MCIAKFSHRVEIKQTHKNKTIGIDLPSEGQREALTLVEVPPPHMPEIIHVLFPLVTIKRSLRTVSSHFYH